jgi:hypothetical protein
MTTAVPVHPVTANLSVVAPATLIAIPPAINQTFTFADSDNDDIPDIRDNCPSVANPDQKDSDATKSSCKVLPADMGGGVECEYTPTENNGDACDTSTLEVNTKQTDTDSDSPRNT